MKRKRIKIIVSGIVLVVASAGLYAYSEFNRKVKDLTYVDAGIRTDAGELISAFEKSEAVSNIKYLDKIVAVKGNVITVEKNADGYYTVILGTDKSMSSVRCSMDSIHQQEVSGLTKGTVITMKGNCSGFNKDELLGSDVILNRCVIDK